MIFTMTLETTLDEIVYVSNLIEFFVETCLIMISVNGSGGDHHFVAFGDVSN